jgi:uncharacterized protein involved in type VI secretion and phage assembly
VQEPEGNGIVIGVVASLDDPERLGRVQVRYPYLEDQRSDWARLVTPMAGKDRGFFFQPDVGDEVVLAYELNEARRPLVLGALWSTEDTPPPNDGARTENNWRFIKSRSGHIVKLNDTANAETIEIIDKDGTQKVLIDSVANTITVICDTGNIEVSAANGTVTIEAMTVEVHATTRLALKSDGVLTIEGTPVNIN